MAKKTFTIKAPLDPRQQGFQPTPPTTDFVSGGDGSDVFYTMTGLESLLDTISRLPDFVKDVAGFEAADIAAEVIVKAKEVVPRDAGNLADSGMSDEYVPGNGISIIELGMWFGAPGVSVGFGATERTIGKSRRSGAATQMGLHEVDPSLYALRMHEELFEHYTTPGTGPKYLEKPLLETAPTIVPRINAAIAAALEKSGNITPLGPLEATLRTVTYPEYGA